MADDGRSLIGANYATSLNADMDIQPPPPTTGGKADRSAALVMALGFDDGYRSLLHLASICRNNSSNIWKLQYLLRVRGRVPCTSVLFHLTNNPYSIQCLTESDRKAVSGS